MPGRASNRGWSRVDRVNEAIREVVATELAHIDDERLELVTVTGVAADPDFRRARVWFSALSRPRVVADDRAPDDRAPDDRVVEEVLGSHRVRLQAAVGRQLRLKRTPELTFQSDPAIAVGTRVEDIIRSLGTGPATTESGDIAAPGGHPGQGGEPT